MLDIGDLDQDGVGELITIATERGRKTRPDLKLGICGEHGGDPESIHFCHRIGLDYVLWSELTDNGSGGKAKLNGSKLGYHYALGAGLLLDVFARRRASLLEAQTGINDTYLIAEWRHQSVDSRTVPWGTDGTAGFDFTGSMLTVGLKLDY